MDQFKKHHYNNNFFLRLLVTVLIFTGCKPNKIQDEIILKSHHIFNTVIRKVSTPLDKYNLPEIFSYIDWVSSKKNDIFKKKPLQDTNDSINGFNFSTFERTLIVNNDFWVILNGENNILLPYENNFIKVQRHIFFNKSFFLTYEYLDSNYNHLPCGTGFMLPFEGSVYLYSFKIDNKTKFDFVPSNLIAIFKLNSYNLSPEMKITFKQNQLYIGSIISLIDKGIEENICVNFIDSNEYIYTMDIGRVAMIFYQLENSNFENCRKIKTKINIRLNYEWLLDYAPEFFFEDTGNLVL